MGRADLNRFGQAGYLKTDPAQGTIITEQGIAAYVGWIRNGDRGSRSAHLDPLAVARRIYNLGAGV